jgi:hypothetical protein
LGEYINILKRLGNLNINYQTNIIVTQFTHKHTAADFVFEKLADELTVKGKSEAISVYELMGKK